MKQIRKKHFSVKLFTSVMAFILLMNHTTSAQIDCSSASGILALMAAPVAINTVDPDDFPLNPSLIVSCTTKVFKTPPASISSICTNAIKMYVFYSTTQSDLSSLPNLASSQLAAVLKKPNFKATITSTSNQNEKKVSVTFPNNKFIAGQRVYYRYGKLIDHPTDMDPMTWSPILNFITPQHIVNLPSACINPDLKPAPENMNEIILFKIIGGSWADAAGHTYQQISGEWCKSFFNTSGVIIEPITGNDPSIGPMRQKTISLPPINWGVGETNNRPINNSFTNQLTRSGENTILATFNISSMTANSTQMGPPFTNRGTRTVYLFEQQNKACAVRTFDAVHGNLNITENNYIVKVDSGNTITECTDSSNDNIKTYSHGGGNTVVFPSN